MDHHKAVSDHTADRLEVLKTRLKECLVDAEKVRARFTKAHDANVWPDLAPACPVPSDEDSETK